jgi:hypothetical protein
MPPLAIPSSCSFNAKRCRVENFHCVLLLQDYCILPLQQSRNESTQTEDSARSADHVVGTRVGAFRSIWRVAFRAGSVLAVGVGAGARGAGGCASGSRSGDGYTGRNGA